MVPEPAWPSGRRMRSRRLLHAARVSWGERHPAGCPPAVSKLDDLAPLLDLDDTAARAGGQRCGASGTSDVIDASIVVVARQRALRVVTSDPDDLRRLDPRVDVVIVDGLLGALPSGNVGALQRGGITVIP